MVSPSFKPMRQLVVLLASAVACCGLVIAQSTDARSSRWHQRQGVAYLDQHNLARALDEFRSAVRLDPRDPTARDYLGVALAESGRTDQAVVEFRKSTELSDSFAPAHFHLGLAYERIGRSSDAIAEYEAALFREPGLVDARYALSAACWKRGDRAGAITLLRQVLGQHPPFAAEGYYNLGLELREQGELDEAVRELKAAVELEPHSPKFQAALGQALAERQSPGAAVEVLRKAVALAPNTPEYRYDLAEALRLKGDYDAAQSEFEVYAESDTEFFYRVVDAQVSFVRPPEGGVAPSLTLHQNGKNMPGKRLP